MQPHAKAIESAAKNAGITEAQLKRLIAIESSGQHYNAKGEVKGGAYKGFTQVGTAATVEVNDRFRKQYGRDLDRLDPEDNIQIGAHYYKQMLKMFGGNEVQAIAAYNWGPGNVRKFIAAGGTDEQLMSSPNVPKETRNYIKMWRSPLS